MRLPDATHIRTLLGPQGPRLELLAEVDSTNTWLLERDFGQTPAQALLVVAGHQRAGRGRRGRSWFAEPGRSVALSLAFEREGSIPPAPGLSLAVGCAIAQALAPHSDGIALKWPNDLLRHGRKTGGILIETRVGRAGPRAILRAVIGVGLNLRAPLDAQALIGQSAGGLFDESEPGLGLERVIALTALAIDSAWTVHARDGLAPFVDAWSRFDAWRGREVVLADAGQRIAEGTALGIDTEGALRIATADGERSMIAGDVSLRLQPENSP